MRRRGALAPGPDPLPVTTLEVIVTAATVYTVTELRN